MELTSEQIENYIKSKGLSCPICGFRTLFDCSSPSIEDDGAMQDIRCGNCESTWTDVYSLSNIDNVEKGTDDRPIQEKFDELVRICVNLTFSALDWDGESKWVDVRKDLFDKIFGIVKKHGN